MPGSASTRVADRSQLRLSEVARHVVIPSGIVDTLWFEVEERCRDFGVEFDAWQDGLGQVILGLREDGTFAATVGGITLSIPRQVAKTFIVMCIVVALCTLFPNLTVLWTAHRTRTATSTFQKIKAMCTRPAVRAHLRAGTNQGTAIRDANGEQEIPFANGSRILFGAREQGFGRGFDEVDIEVFDEAQILTIKALEDMVAATNQSRWDRGALLFYMGTPPRPEDPGEMFAARRAEALAAKDGRPDFGEAVAVGDAVYVECSADARVGQPGGPSLDDPHQVELSNPSFPHRTPPVSVARLRKNLPHDDAWRREGLGVWDTSARSHIIPPAAWNERRAEPRAPDAPPMEGRRGYAVKFSMDGATVALAGAVQPADGPVLVEVIEHRSMAHGTGWLVEWLAARVRDSVGVAIDGKAHAGALIDDLIAAGVPRPRRAADRHGLIVAPTVAEVVAANSGFLEAVIAGDMVHSGQPGLDRAVDCAERRKIGNAGGWGFAPTGNGDVTPLEAGALAMWLTRTSRRVPGKKATGVVL